MHTQTIKKFTIICATFFLMCATSRVYALTPSDPQWSEAHGIAQLQLPAAWDVTQGSHSVIVAVIDTGVSIDNPDIAPNVWTNPLEKDNGLDNDHDGFVGDMHGWNFIDNTPDVLPHATSSSARVGLNHGTVVAGIIGGVGNNNIGSAGVNWRVQIMPLKILDDQGDGDSDTAVKAIDYAIAHKADIINLSFVGTTPSLNFIQAIRRAYRAGILVVAAAGNGAESSAGTNLDVDPQYPVCFDDPLKEENWVIGVGALDENGLPAAFSNYGARCVDISAPGRHIPSTVMYDPTKGADGIFGGSWSGTSVAAPFVSGAAALIKSVQPTWGPDEIRKALLDSIDPIPGNDDLRAGRGSLNVAKAIRYATHGGDGGVPDGVFVGIDRRGGQLFAKVLDASFKEVHTFPLATRVAAQNVHVVTADLSGSGVANLVVAVPDRAGSLIKIFQRDGKLLRTFRPFGTKERGALQLVSYDVNGDGNDELIVLSPTTNTLAILTASGNAYTQFQLPEVGVHTGLAVVRTPAGDTRILTAFFHQHDVTTYEWSAIGAFDKMFTVATAGTPRAFGAVDRAGNGTQQIYLTTTTKKNIATQYYGLDGSSRGDVMTIAPVTGRLFGIAFAHVPGTIGASMVVATQKGLDVSFSLVASNGALGTTQHVHVGGGDQWEQLYFGR